jgi:hypothetical protein
MSKSLLTLLVASLTLSFVAVPQDDGRYLKDRDLGKLASALGKYVEAANARSKLLEAEHAVQNEMEKLAKKLKKAPVPDIMALPEDLGQALFLSRNYPKVRGLKPGKVLEAEYEGFNDMVLPYAVWAPSKYDAKKKAYPLFLTIPAEDEQPKQHIIEQWMEGVIRDGAIIASPEMPDKVEDWTAIKGDSGLARVMVLMRAMVESYAVDPDRIYICGRGTAGVPAAVKIASLFPDRFAGVIGRAGDLSGTVSAQNFGNLPTWLSGAGARATAFKAEAKSLGWEDLVTIEPEGREANFWTWANSNPRRTLPSTLTLYPHEPFPTRCYWVKSASGFSEGANIKATVDRELNQITLEGDKVTDVILYLNDQIIDLSRPVTVLANGQKHVDQIPRSFRTCLELIQLGTSDPKRVFVATMAYTLPAKPQ